MAVRSLLCESPGCNPETQMGEFKVTQATYIEPVLESQPQKTGRSQLQYTRIRPCQILFFLGLDSVVSRPAFIVYLPIGLF